MNKLRPASHIQTV